MAEEVAVHIVLPDSQVKSGVPTDHLRWIGQYIVDKFAGKPNVKIIHLGDHADMPSLSSYDKGKRAMEGRRYIEDIKAANDGWAVLNAPLEAYNLAQRAKRKPQWWPERHITLGNHCERITRAAEDNAQIEGLVSLDHLDYARSGWVVHPFLEVLWLDGVAYAHYFYNQFNGRPLSGMCVTRLKQLGHSFTQGHQQVLEYAIRFVRGRSQHGLVAGACYLHNENYLGPQQAYWRGIIICYDVRDGSYDPAFLSLDYLCRRYEGMELQEFLAEQEAA